MADKKKQHPEPQGQHDLKHTIVDAEAFYQKNANTINIAGLVIVLLIAGFFGYKYLYKAPREKKAQAMVFKAQQYFAVDSFKLALNGDGNNYGFLQVINRYGGTKVGELSKYCAGVCYVKLGEFQQGVNYLKGFNAGDKVVQAMDYGILGDAYMELGNTNEGINYYKKAAGYNDNGVISPFYLLRAGLALEKAGRNDEAVAVLKQIKDKYPLSNEGRNIDKFLARLGDTNNF